MSRVHYWQGDSEMIILKKWRNSQLNRIRRVWRHCLAKTSTGSSEPCIGQVGRLHVYSIVYKISCVKKMFRISLRVSLSTWWTTGQCQFPFIQRGPTFVMKVQQSRVSRPVRHITCSRVNEWGAVVWLWWSRGNQLTGSWLMIYKINTPTFHTRKLDNKFDWEDDFLHWSWSITVDKTITPLKPRFELLPGMHVVQPGPAG